MNILEHSEQIMTESELQAILNRYDELLCQFKIHSISSWTYGCGKRIVEINGGQTRIEITPVSKPTYLVKAGVKLDLAQGLVKTKL